MAEVTNEDIMKKLDKLDDYFVQLAKNQQDICDLINKLVNLMTLKIGIKPS